MEVVPSAGFETVGGVYADIALAEKTTIDAEAEAAEHQHPQGIVYAALEFDQRTSQAERTTNANNSHHADAPSNAETSEITGHQNETTSEIRPIVDVYPLPSSNVTPASTEMTQGPIYANSST